MRKFYHVFISRVSRNKSTKGKHPEQIMFFMASCNKSYKSRADYMLQMIISNVSSVQLIACKPELPSFEYLY